MPSILKQLEFDRQLDLTLIRQFRKSGDLGLLGQVYSKYLHMVYGVAYKYLKNRTMAQDIVIQLFEKLTIEAVKLEIANFRSWLYVATKNQCLAELRKQQANEDQFPNWQEEQKLILENGFNIHPLDDGHKLSETLMDGIKKLNKDQNAAIDLFYLKKKSYREIAVIMNADEKKVKLNIHEGKRNLKIFLESSNG